MSSTKNRLSPLDKRLSKNPYVVRCRSVLRPLTATWRGCQCDGIGERYEKSLFAAIKCASLLSAMHRKCYCTSSSRSDTLMTKREKFA